MTSIPIKLHASFIAHRDFSLCLSLIVIPLLKKEMEQNTGQYNTPALGGRELLWGQQRCGHGLVRKEFVLQAQGFLFNSRAHV